MNYPRREITGFIRGSARMAHMCAEALKEFSEDGDNHLSATDASEIRNLVRSNRESLKRITEYASVFEREMEVRKQLV